MLRKQGSISRRQMLESVPHRNPAVRWETLDSGRWMAVYRRDRSGPRRWWEKVVPRPETSQLLLDDIGSKVMREIDGRKTVKDLIAYVSREWKLSRKEAEVALLKYMEMLGRRRLIGFEVRMQEGEG